MIGFLLYTIVFWLAVAGFTLMLYVSTQRGNWLGKWQDQLRKYDLKGNVFMYSIGGGCQLCFSHAIAQVSFIFYLVFFLITNIWQLGIITSIIWYVVYVAFSTNLNLFFITKLYKGGR